MLTSLEQEIEDHFGWDTPASLWFLVPAQPAEPLSQTVYAQEFALRLAGVLDGHPFHALLSRRAPEGALAAVLATEGWARVVWDPDGPPSEIRILHAVFASGAEFSLQRFRAHPPEIIPTSRLTGRVPWALRRAMGHPSLAGDEIEGPLRPPREIASGISASLFVSELYDMADPGVDARTRRRFVASIPERIEVLRAFSPAFSLDHATWEEALTASRALLASRAEEVLESSDAGLLASLLSQLSLLDWVDAPLWARLLQESVPTSPEFYPAFVHSADVLGLSPQTRTRIRRMFRPWLDPT